MVHNRISGTAFFHYDTTAYYSGSTATTGFINPPLGNYAPRHRNDIWNQIDSLKEQIKQLQKEEIRHKNRTDIKLQLRNARTTLRQLEAKAKKR